MAPTKVKSNVALIHDILRKTEQEQTPEKLELSISGSTTRFYSIKDRCAFFETKAKKQIPRKEQIGLSRMRSRESLNGSSDCATKSQTKAVIITNTFDVKVMNNSKKRSKTVKELTTKFERNEIEQRGLKEHKSTIRRNQEATSTAKTAKKTDIYMMSIEMLNKRNPEKTTTHNVVGESNKLSPKSPGKHVTKSCLVRNAIKNFERNATKSPERNATKNPEREATKSNVTNATKSSKRNATKSSERKSTTYGAVGNRRVYDATSSFERRMNGTTAVGTDFSIISQITSASKIKTATVNKTVVSSDDDAQIEEIFDLLVLKTMTPAVVRQQPTSQAPHQPKNNRATQKSSTNVATPTNKATRIRGLGRKRGGGRGDTVMKSVFPQFVRLDENRDKIDDTFELLYRETVKFDMNDH